MPWNDSPLRELVIPQDAGPSDPRIVISVDPIPFGPDEISAAIRFYINATDFFYIGVIRPADLPNIGHLITGVEQPSISSGHTYGDMFTDSAAPAYWEAKWSGFYDDTGAAGHVTIGDFVEVSGESYVRFESDFNGTGDIQIHESGADVSQPRGVFDVETSGATNFTTTETVVESLTDGAATFQVDRRYLVSFHGGLTSTIASDKVRVRIRQTNASGTVERDCGEITLSATVGVPVPVDVSCLYTGRNVVGETVALSMVRSAGTGTITYTSDSAWVEDKTSTAVA